MESVIRKLLLNKYPDYDFNRYRFQAGDVVRTNDGALVVVDYSAVMYVKAFVVRRSLKYREYAWTEVSYDDLPNVTEFISERINISKSLNWRVGRVVFDDYGNTVLLTKDSGDGWFDAYVLRSENTCYLYTNVAVKNPWYDYVIK